MLTIEDYKLIFANAKRNPNLNWFTRWAIFAIVFSFGLSIFVVGIVIYYPIWMAWKVSQELWHVIRP